MTDKPSDGAERAIRSPRFAIDCPHCDWPSRVRTSRSLTSLVRTAMLECSNPDCLHTFSAQLAVTHTIRPSLVPRADVALPIATPRASSPSNDNGGPNPPPTAAACPSSAAAASR